MRTIKSRLEREREKEAPIPFTMTNSKILAPLIVMAPNDVCFVKKREKRKIVLSVFQVFVHSYLL